MHQPILPTCLSCHDKELEKNHPIYDHPVIADSDPINKDREFNCVSCHEVHISDTKQLLKKEASCKACHTK